MYLLLINSLYYGNIIFEVNRKRKPMELNNFFFSFTYQKSVHLDPCREFCTSVILSFWLLQNSDLE